MDAKHESEHIHAQCIARGQIDSLIPSSYKDQAMYANIERSRRQGMEEESKLFHQQEDCADRSQVKHWFSAMNSELRKLNSAAAILTWRLSTEEGMEASDTASELGELRSAWRNQRCQEAGYLWPLVTRSERRQLYLLCRGPIYLPHQSSKELSSSDCTLKVPFPFCTHHPDAAVLHGPSRLVAKRDMTLVSGKLLNIYTTSRVCRRHGEPCYSGEPDLERLMKRSRDPAELLWAWQEWRRVVGPSSKHLFTTLVDLQNQVATNNGSIKTILYIDDIE
uniref:Uncharacterized protein n=1 Tax=Timema shepardi TaxID=629360 RepID=A0A7R9G0Y0_TIMSH|nr:unnamed protein product [Timema shepardi]